MGLALAAFHGHPAGWLQEDVQHRPAAVADPTTLQRRADRLLCCPELQRSGITRCWWRILWEDRRNWCPDREATLLASAQRLYRKAGQWLARLEELEDELRELDLVRSPSPVGPAGSQPLQLRGIRLLVGRNNRQNDRISIQGGGVLFQSGAGQQSRGGGKGTRHLQADSWCGFRGAAFAGEAVCFFPVLP